MTSTPDIPVKQDTPEMSDVTVQLYKAVIGPVNQDYYLRVFAHFDAKGKVGVLWHWPAFFSTLNWLVFRKMWLLALWFAAFSITFTLVVFGIGKLVFNYSPLAESLIGGVSLVLGFIVPGLFANAAYYKFCEKTINDVLVTGVGVPATCELLSRRASTRKRLIALVLINLTALLLLVGLVSMLPGVGSTALQLSTLPAPATSAPAAAPASTSVSAPTSAATPTAAVSEPEHAASAVAVKIECADCPPAQAVPELSANQESSRAQDVELLPPAPAVGGGKDATASAPKVPALPVVPKVLPPAPLSNHAPVPAPAPPPPPPPAPAPAPPPTPAPAAAAAAAAPDANASAQAQQYFIQVGAFAELGNARHTLAQLEALGLEAGAAPVVVKDGRLTRIRVGPFKTRAEARKAAEKIKAQGLPALFVKL